MSRGTILAVLLLLMVIAGSASAGRSFDGDGNATYPNNGMIWASAVGVVGSGANVGDWSEEYDPEGNLVEYAYSSHVSACRGPLLETTSTTKRWHDYPGGYSAVVSQVLPNVDECLSSSASPTYAGAHRLIVSANTRDDGSWYDASGSAYIRVTITSRDMFYIEGNTSCLSSVALYDSGMTQIETDQLGADNYYKFINLIEGHSYTLVFDNGAYHDFTCSGNKRFDYDACIWVYGYTCGVDSIKLYKDDGGWVLDDSAGQTTGYDVYEMLIEDGEDYKISFTDSGTVVHNQTFSCTGDHVLIDFDRCNWIYPPNGPDIPIYLWTGYDYNVVIFKDVHGNMVENSQLAIYDETDSQYLQKWTDTSDGYTLLGAQFDTDHDVRLSLRTFDGVFTLDTTYPANGTALVGEENITTTNWTIPIKYNLNVLPVDQYGMALFDVFCGLSEYTPLNPGAFWGMDLSDQGYVPVTNCSGFAMCDIIAEKEGYADYKVEALNWTSKSAMVKDYRHNVVMEEE